MKEKYYFAYGSNLNMLQMAKRCPMAKPVGSYKLKGWKLVFRGVADIEPTVSKDIYLPIGIWKITKKCEDALDRYEGFPRLYGKKTFNIKGKNMMTYVMNNDGYMPPSTDYFNTIFEGYRDFGLDSALLFESAGWANFVAYRLESKFKSNVSILNSWS